MPICIDRKTWRRQVADSMHAVAGLLSADVSLSHPLDLSSQIERALPCDASAIWLVGRADLPMKDTFPISTAFSACCYHSSEGITTEVVEEHLMISQTAGAWLAEALNAAIPPLIRSQIPLHDLRSERSIRTLLGFTGKLFCHRDSMRW